MAFNIEKIGCGYGLVADRYDLPQIYDLANHSTRVTAVKALDKWLLSSGSPDENEKCAAGDYAIIADIQVGLAGNTFEAGLSKFVHRVPPDVVTVSPFMPDTAVWELSGQLEEMVEAGTLARRPILALTACLPDMSAELIRVLGGSGEFVNQRYELARAIGDAMVYGAAGDLLDVDKDTLASVPYIAAGISPDGRPYGKKQHGVMRHDEARDAGAWVVLIGSAYKDWEIKDLLFPKGSE